MTLINFMSVKLYVQMQNMFSVCKLVVCGVVIVTGVVLLCTGEFWPLAKGRHEKMVLKESIRTWNLCHLILDPKL
jgi:L-asparagine transporter-like permease